MKQGVKNRIQLIDAARGICVLLMVLHHLMYDLVVFLGFPEWIFTNPVLDILHYFFAGLFIFISGIASDFSRSNVKRGLLCLAAALAITLVTWLMDMIIVFGILHFLGFCMVFYGLTYKLWDAIPRKIAPVLYLILLAASAFIVNRYGSFVESRWLWMFGFVYNGFSSADYFPILPWNFVFLAGTWLGKYIKEGKMPDKFYTAKVPYFPSIGRKALIIYIIHQPVLYAATMLIAKMLDK